MAMNEPPVCKKCEEEYSLRDGYEPTDYCDSCAHEVVQDLALKLDLANMELHTIDEILARRPALGNFHHRTEKIEHVLAAVARYDGLLRRYGRHQNGCVAQSHCTCGWNQIEKQLRAGE